MCVCAYTYTYIHTHTHTHTHLKHAWSSPDISTYVCTYVCVCVSIHIHLHTHAFETCLDISHITYAKETCYIHKRDLLHTQKKPATYPKETYYIRKRDLLHTQKRPITCLFIPSSRAAVGSINGCNVCGRVGCWEEQIMYKVKYLC